MEVLTGQEWNNRLAAPQLGLADGAPSGVNSFLAWLMVWLQYCLQNTQLPFHARARETVRRTYEPNRYWRRFGERDIAPVHDNRPYFILAGRGRTPGQFTEWIAQFSGRGRVSVYRMRYWRKTVKGKAAPLGTEHEYWRDPLGRMCGRASKLLCGVWAVHLWPGWRGLFSTLIAATPKKTSRADNFACPDVSCLDTAFPHLLRPRLNKAIGDVGPTTPEPPKDANFRVFGAILVAVSAIAPWKMKVEINRN